MRIKSQFRALGHRNSQHYYGAKDIHMLKFNCSLLSDSPLNRTEESINVNDRVDHSDICDGDIDDSDDNIKNGPLKQTRAASPRLCLRALEPNDSTFAPIDIERHIPKKTRVDVPVSNVFVRKSIRRARAAPISMAISFSSDESSPERTKFSSMPEHKKKNQVNYTTPPHGTSVVSRSGSSVRSSPANSLNTFGSVSPIPGPNRIDTFHLGGHYRGFKSRG